MFLWLWSAYLFVRCVYEFVLLVCLVVGGRLFNVDCFGVYPWCFVVFVGFCLWLLLVYVC